MTQIKLGFIGGGNMAGSIIGGLADDNAYNIFVADPDTDKLSALQDNFGAQPCQSNEQLVCQCDAVVVATKPQVMQKILKPLSDSYAIKKPLVISIAAGVTSTQILKWLNDPTAACIRVMPNTPALVQTGASGLFAVNADKQQKIIAEKIMNAVGITVWLEDEALIDSVTAVSGSGPAYFFYLMESIYSSGIKNGLGESDARKLTLQTALGAAKLAANSEIDFATLRQQVTSPGGTTEAAINVLEQYDFKNLIDKAVTRAAIRSKELAQE